MGAVVQAFSDPEAQVVQRELAALSNRLRLFEGHFEEYHWRPIYYKAKGIEGARIWSNLAFNDLLHEGLGVEWKVLKRNSPKDDQGNSLMHPAATRKLVFNPQDDADTAKNEILTQWAAGIRDFERRVSEASEDGSSDIRWGILLWSPLLTEFLYFEEQIDVPDPDDFTARWVDGQHRGRATRNLHIFERDSGVKRYSVTLPQNGAKLQPYFDIPTVEEGAHLFEIDAEVLVPLWVSQQTFDALGAVDELDHDMIVRRLMDAPGPDLQ